MTTTVDPSIVSRIRKILALAASSTFEGEAQAAALKVQELLQAHGLTMMQVEAGGGASADGKRAKVQSDRRAMYKWQVALMRALADNNFCFHDVDVVWSDDSGRHRRSKRHLLIGREVNVEVTLLTYDYLCAAVRRAAENGGFRHSTNEAQHHVFLDGAVTRLAERLAERTREAEKESERRRSEEAAKARHPGAPPAAPGTALVLADVYSSERDLNEDHRLGLEPGTTAARRAREAALNRQRKTRMEELEAQGVPYPKNWYLACGHEEADAQKWHDDYHKTVGAENPRRHREWRETEADRRRQRKYASEAYQSGRSAGNHIGLDRQVNEQKKDRLQ